MWFSAISRSAPGDLNATDALDGAITYCYRAIAGAAAAAAALTGQLRGRMRR
jgi:hypothetical protein